jgi:SAM-dependent methyltransferase
LSTIRWFEIQTDFIDAARSLQDEIARASHLLNGKDSYQGFCAACQKQTTFSINRSHVERPNLRENLTCIHCRLNTRQRLMLSAMLSDNGAPNHSGARGALLEKTTRLYQRSHARMTWLRGSEYLGEDRKPGGHYWWSTRWWRWRHTRHESITSLSYDSGSLDLLAHSDVLEHVYDTALALRESARVLRPGGIMLFTVPFFMECQQSILRGRPRPSGGIEHLQPPEYHGDGLSHSGIYTFHNFGWDLLDQIRDAGFSRAEVGFCYEPREGFHVDDAASPESWKMLTNIFRATR